MTSFHSLHINQIASFAPRFCAAYPLTKMDIKIAKPFPLSSQWAHVTPALASLFTHGHRSDLALWSKLEDDHELSRLCSQFLGKETEDEAKQWRKAQSTVKADPTNDIGPECYALDLGIELECSKLWVRQDYIRIYDYCSKRHEEGQSCGLKGAYSVVITGQPGIGVFPSSVASYEVSNNPSHEKVKHIGSLMPSAVVSANRSHFFLVSRWLLLLICRGWSVSTRCQESLRL